MAVVVLRRLDRDRDGEVSAQELAAGKKRGGNARPKRGRFDGALLARIDADGDGKISKDEAPERMAKRFQRLDKDGDGFIDKAEQAAMREAFRKRSGRGKRPDRDAGQGGTDKPKRPPVKE